MSCLVSLQTLHNQKTKQGRLCKTGVATRICFSDYPKQPFSCAWQNQITFQLLKGDLLCKSCFFFFSSGLLLPKIRRVHWAGLQCKWTINLLNSAFQTAWWTTPSHCDVPTADPAPDWWQGTWAGKENTQLSGMVIGVGKELFFSLLVTSVGSEADQRQHGPVTCVNNSCPTSQISRF